MDPASLGTESVAKLDESHVAALLKPETDFILAGNRLDFKLNRLVWLITSHRGSDHSKPVIRFIHETDTTASMMNPSNQRQLSVTKPIPYDSQTESTGQTSQLDAARLGSCYASTKSATNMRPAFPQIASGGGTKDRLRSRFFCPSFSREPDRQLVSERHQQELQSHYHLQLATSFKGPPTCMFNATDQFKDAKSSS